MDPIQIILTVLGAAGGSGVIIAGLSAWLGKVWASRIADAHKQALKMTAQVDLDLRERRIKAYEPLWKKTAFLPKWPKAEGVTYEQIWKFSEELRDWYFAGGGMYLSRTTHDKAYSPLQDAILELNRAKPSGKVTDAHYEEIRQKCSALRSAITEDIESRRESPL